ncbi:hypothetical protein V1277_004002 [Bradyrhizobium sp. AZCC 1588]|uniref:hypothetical protein n=1 Tax=unclassified Bradyrhizobium TaxID=2631580 RepID=UPI002FF048B1
MKRAFVFLVLAPVTVFFAALMIWVAADGPRHLDFACVVAVVLSILTLPMSAISWISDEFLVSAFPVSLRVYLIAMVGATAATAETLAVFSSLFPPSIVMTLAIGGAIVTAACSLLSNDYGGRQGHRFEQAGA